MAKLPDFVMISRPNANGDFLLKPRKIPGYYLISFVSINGFPVNKYLTKLTNNVHECCSQWAFTCSKLTIETLEQGVKYVQS